MTRPQEDRITLTMSRASVMALARMTRQRLRKLERQQANRPPFVPEEGKMDATEVALSHLRDLLDQLVAHCGDDFDIEDGGRPSRRPSPVGD